MQCVICKHGETQDGTTTVTLERNGSTIVFKDVPADVCESCGEAYLSSDVTHALLRQAETISRSGAMIDVRTYRLDAA